MIKDQFGGDGVAAVKNYKGICAEEEKEKFIDPITGAHFEYNDLCKRLNVMKERRQEIDARLGLNISQDSS